MMGMETGRRKLILTSRLAERHNQAPFAGGADTKHQALLHLPHTCRHLPLPLHTGNGSQLLTYPIPALRFRFQNVPPTTALPTSCDYLPAFVRMRLIGKVLNCGIAWNVQGQLISGIANNKTLRMRVCFRGCHGLGCTADEGIKV